MLDHSDGAKPSGIKQPVIIQRPGVGAPIYLDPELLIASVAADRVGWGWRPGWAG